MSDPHQRSDRWLHGLFAVLVFAGSFLLFVVQPMVARMALPLLGGAPNVWNSAMLVFQTLLLGGYAYAHLLSRLTFGRQVVVHLLLLAFSMVTLPPLLAALPPASPGWEVLWVPALFLATIGPVFLLLSAQASLLQNWFAMRSGGRDPYRLYAASNLGSFTGLLAYPFWIEGHLTLSGQGRAWSIAYVALALAVAVLGVQARRAARMVGTPEPGGRVIVPIDRRRVATWLALSAVPSGLMLSTTTLLTTDLMAVPLLWVIPLGLYLLSFTLAFSDRGTWAGILTGYAPFLLLLVGGLAMISGGQSNPAIALAMVALLFVLSVALHGRLFALRPDPASLTFFYLMLAIGGALGGVLTALLAPLILDWVYEHAMLLCAAALLLPQRQFLSPLRHFWEAGTRRYAAAAVIVAGAAIGAWFLSQAVAEGEGEAILVLSAALVVAGIASIGMRPAYLAVLACLMFGLGGIATIATSVSGERTRSYFGVYGVEEADDGSLRKLVHGTTMHGQQFLDPTRRLDPTSYYGAFSGAGLVLTEAEPDARVGIVGLGVGTLACYRKPRQEWTFFEIDPAILRYSRDGTFTFLRECAPDARVEIGDARLSLERGRADRFEILVIDAFTSDAIPIHMLTREAFSIYSRALVEDGTLLVHISNRFFDLAPMISALAADGGWKGRIRRNIDDIGPGQSPSIWIALSRDSAALHSGSGAWWEALPDPEPRPWTDDAASLTQLLFD